ncbi:hypothetical protein ACIPW5_06525 [Streptomyces sp. NPDC090077]|uniref:hypothetical protein n=1 Tax=Streptomyces sp. NPDC090077 TaxID=3365938 RepID=UPI0038302F15
MLKTGSPTNVAVALSDGVAPFESGIFYEVFGIDQHRQGLPTYDFAVCAAGAAARS